MDIEKFADDFEPEKTIEKEIEKKFSRLMKMYERYLENQSPKLRKGLTKSGRRFFSYLIKKSDDEFIYSAIAFIYEVYSISSIIAEIYHLFSEK
jgi:hypothetical protein